MSLLYLKGLKVEEVHHESLMSYNILLKINTY